MKNFIEVGKTEEEQAEQIKKWIKGNALQIIAGVAQRKKMADELLYWSVEILSTVVNKS